MTEIYVSNIVDFLIYVKVYCLLVDSAAFPSYK
jgi:hypothetical protein